MKFSFAQISSGSFFIECRFSRYDIPSFTSRKRQTRAFFLFRSDTRDSIKLICQLKFRFVCFSEKVFRARSFRVKVAVFFFKHRPRRHLSDLKVIFLCGATTEFSYLLHRPPRPFYRRLYLPRANPRKPLSSVDKLSGFADPRRGDPRVGNHIEVACSAIKEENENSLVRLQNQTWRLCLVGLFLKFVSSMQLVFFYENIIETILTINYFEIVRVSYLYVYQETRSPYRKSLMGHSGARNYYAKFVFEIFREQSWEGSTCLM